MVTLISNTINTPHGKLTIAITQGLRGVGPFHVKTYTDAGPLSSTEYRTYVTARAAFAELHTLMARSYRT